MATTNLGADSVLANLPAQFAPMPAVLRTLSQFDREKLEGFITVAIGLLDVMDGDPDVEDGEGQTHVDATGHFPPGIEVLGDCEDSEHAYSEWSSRGRIKLQNGGERTDQHEDDEDADPAEDDDPDTCSAGDDQASLFVGDDGHAGDPEDAEEGNDAEREQMSDDVPCLPVFALEPNLFNGEREYLGLSNLKPTFISNGPHVKAAD